MRWYSRNGRDLPWRRTRDPYAILVSEFMLQQTQVATVVPCYNQWLKRLPKRYAAHFNSALIDLGALVCFPRKPKCEICPVKRFCRAINPGILPVKKAHPRTRRLTENHVYVVRQNKVLLERSAGRWPG